jgi:predicted nicotinamide N-methyase
VDLSDLQLILHQTLRMGRLDMVAPPGCDEVKLGLINADFPTGPLPSEVMAAVMEKPAYWAFCWGSGLALARLLLDEPHRVAGKRVVDLGSGSGVVAIAAALAGAKAVIACDLDPQARAATRVNAAANQVELTVVANLQELPAGNDLLLMADVLYDKSNLALLVAAGRLANEVLVADSRISELPGQGFEEIRTSEALTYPNLGEFDEFRTVHVFHHATGLPQNQGDAPLCGGSGERPLGHR